MHDGEKADAFDEYAFFGGLPFVLSRPDETAKMQYLSSLCSEVYLKDIVERKKIEREDVLSDVLNLVWSSVGSLTNPKKIEDTLRSKEKIAAEMKPFSLTGDSFPKIIVRGDIRKRWYDEGGILNIGIIDFLLDDDTEE